MGWVHTTLVVTPEQDATLRRWLAATNEFRAIMVPYTDARGLPSRATAWAMLRQIVGMDDAPKLMVAAAARENIRWNEKRLRYKAEGKSFVVKAHARAFRSLALDVALVSSRHVEIGALRVRVADPVRDGKYAPVIVTIVGATWECHAKEAQLERVARQN